VRESEKLIKSSKVPKYTVAFLFHCLPLARFYFIFSNMGDAQKHLSPCEVEFLGLVFCRCIVVHPRHGQCKLRDTTANATPVALKPSLCWRSVARIL